MSNDLESSASPSESSAAARALPPLRVARAGRRWQPVRDFFRADRLRESGKTLALVVPLTVLIWVWAEREQTLGTSAVPERRTFYLDVRGNNPAKSATLAPGQTDAVVVELSGPKNGFDALDSASRELNQRRLVVEVNDGLDPGGPYPIPVDGLLNQQKIFRDAGLTVLSTEPASVRVLVDRQVERDLPVRLPEALASAVQRPTFEPSAVRVRGPEQTLARLEANGDLVAELDILNLSDFRNRGQTRVELSQVPLKPIAAPGVALEVNTVARVTLQLSQEEQGEIASMVVNVSKPAGLEPSLRATLKPLVLTGVKVVGPGDVLRQLREGRLLPAPYAEVKITREDAVARTGTRMPTFRDLPPGVRVVEGSVSPVAFEVSEATASDGVGGLP